MIFRLFAVLLAGMAFMGIFGPYAEGEAGMIPMDSPVGEIGGRGHWYTLRTMKGIDYWADPAVNSDVRENEDGTYTILGEPPVSVSLVLHPEWYPDDEPWRRAIDWMRQAEQVFRNSGVPIRFIVEHIEVWEDFPDTIEQSIYDIPASEFEHGADLVVGLKPVMAGDPHCGVAYIDGHVSISSCNPLVLAHELGHNFGLYHSFNSGREGYKGYCIEPEADAYECAKGTIMSYSGINRVPFFAANGFAYKGDLLGTEEHTAVEHLNKVKTAKALRWELSNGDEPKVPYDMSETEYHLCR